MNDKPQYPITIFYRDLGDWVEKETFHTEMDLLVGLEFADTNEQENAWAIKAVDALGRNINLKIEAIELIKFELKDSTHEQKI
ncbi:hypothetical protein [Methylophaga thalassica]|uniref:hypothetical protein n=1 Tax=Methylophaga aminisulfidivorans TaxID=230105 RepID=UPI003A90E172